MFYSFDNLVGKNGQFSLIWKMAMFSDKRKRIAKASIMDVDIPKTCASLLSFFPNKENIPVEARTKFSLYLLSQLMYGVVLVFESQTLFLEIDVKTARSTAENLFLNPKPFTKEKTEGVESRRKGTKRKFEEIVNFDIKDLPPTNLGDLDAVGMALYNQITLQDPAPSRAPAFMLDDELPFVTVEQQWELRTFFDEQPLGERLGEAQPTEERSTLVNLEPLELPMQENLDWLRSLDEPMEIQPHTFQEPTTGELFPELQPPADEQAKGDKETEAKEKSPEKVAEKILDVLELATEVVTPSFKRRRVATRIRDDVTMIPWETMKSGLTDYTSNSRTVKDAIARPQVNTELDDILKPYPTWMSRPFNKELRDLYKSARPEKLTYEQAAKMEIGAPIPRGPESQLWRYEGSSAEPSVRGMEELRELDEDLRLVSGIAYLHPTPEKEKEREHSMPRFEEEFRFPEEDVEFARRSSVMGGPISARHSTLLAEEISRHIGRADLVTMEEEAQISENATRAIIKEKITSAVGMSAVAVSFNSLIPVRSNSDKDAARAFSSLLELIKNQKISARQDVAYGEILIASFDRRASTASQ